MKVTMTTTLKDGTVLFNEQDYYNAIREGLGDEVAEYFEGLEAEYEDELEAIKIECDDSVREQEQIAQERDDILSEMSEELEALYDKLCNSSRWNKNEVLDKIRRIVNMDVYHSHID